MNWIKNQKSTELSVADKVKELLKIHYKLVLVQIDELTRLRNKKVLKDFDSVYINGLYKHYILEGLGKTYISSF